MLFVFQLYYPHYLLGAQEINFMRVRPLTHKQVIQHTVIQLNSWVVVDME
jgi:hypothetical protein